MSLDDLTQYDGGSDNRYDTLMGIIYTEGVRYVAESAQAYWLIDLIVSWQCNPKVRAEEFQVFKLALNEKGGCTIIIGDGNDNELGKQEIEYTDFPKDISIWCVKGTIMLPGEY